MSVILTLNAGSSSVKFALYEAASLGERARGQVERIGANAHLEFSIAGERFERDVEAGDHAQALQHILAAAREALGGDPVIGVGHRIVHGGLHFVAPCVLNQQVLDELEALDPLAPLHQPHNLACARAAAGVFPGAIEIGCFDTAFHRGQPFESEAFALPLHFYHEGVRRYGFHGLSYDYVSGELARIAPDIAQGRVVIAHLGNGASMCGLKDGKSFTSTMGFSALEGLPMGTRCGEIDPGVLLYLMDARNMSAVEITRMLYRESGLLGLSGISHDMRALEQSAAPEARQAISYFIMRCRRELGALAAMIGGLDALVFTAGIGEHAANVRAGICETMDWLGLAVDAEKNAASARRIEAGAVPVFVIPTNEELVIARAVKAAL